MTLLWHFQASPHSTLSSTQPMAQSMGWHRGYTTPQSAHGAMWDTALGRVRLQLWCGHGGCTLCSTGGLAHGHLHPHTKNGQCNAHCLRGELLNVGAIKACLEICRHLLIFCKSSAVVYMTCHSKQVKYVPPLNH